MDKYLPVYKSKNNSSDDNIQYLRTQARSQSLMISSYFFERKSGKSDSDGLIDIDKLLAQ